jgi:hypothetical protein
MDRLLLFRSQIRTSRSYAFTNMVAEYQPEKKHRLQGHP